MEAYAQALTYAIPGFMILLIVEYIASVLMGRSVNEPMDTISSLSSGMTNTLKELLGLAVVIVSYTWLYDHLAIFEIESTTWLFILSFILVDFAAYWGHRFNHEINVLWNRHIVHHSSEEYNLACALRQSISDNIKIYFFLSIPLALVGIPISILAVVGPIHLFAQFWYHTRLINKMGWLEYIIMTPSHHRVHHAINPEYIDKNYSAIFIIWDKWFGTFQPEEESILPVYGVKSPVRTWNPIIINYQHLFGIFKDAWRTQNWGDKIKIWFMPTGWRPEDVSKLYPRSVIEDVFSLEKYNPEVPKGLLSWSWIQLIINNLLIYFLLIQIAEINVVGLTIFITFLALSIFAYTSLMDLHKVSVLAEVIKIGIGIYITVKMSWFGLDSYLPSALLLMTIYLFCSLVMTLYFIHVSSKQPQLIPELSN